MKQWQPLQDGQYIHDSIIDGRIKMEVSGNGEYIAIWGPEEMFEDITLSPFKVRLCQLTDAPPVVPPDVAETIRSALINLRGDATRIPNYGGIDTDEVDAALSWLNSVMEAEDEI